MKRMKPTLPVEKYLQRFPLNIRDIVNLLRSRMKEAESGMIERVYPGWNVIGYRVSVQRSSVYIGFIAPYENRVVIGFEYGMLLSDPHRVLEGSGKQVRWITCPSKKVPKRSILMPLILEAVSIAKERRNNR
ncbi:MAG: hypothetical protein HYZ01_02900 [Ignavibacteriales bacterium]|nr:hypothetical protein [Ignavibacteriales bacterium]